MSKKAYSSNERKAYTDANLAAWNEVAPVHKNSNQEELLKEFLDPNLNAFDNHCTDRLLEIGIEEKSIAQLCCNNGRELLSLKNMGAGLCVGFDASPLFIEQAKELCSVTAHNDIEFITTDIYDIPEAYVGPYDLVLSTIGVIGWMPNLKEFFEVYGKLTKPGGYLFIEDTHPVLEMYEPDENGQNPEIKNSYFKQDPWVGIADLDYFEYREYGSKPNYYFQHTLSEVMMAAIGQGFDLLHFAELDFDISGIQGGFNSLEHKPPMGMTMVWQKR